MHVLVYKSTYFGSGESAISDGQGCMHTILVEQLCGGVLEAEFWRRAETERGFGPNSKDHYWLYTYLDKKQMWTWHEMLLRPILLHDCKVEIYGLLKMLSMRLNRRCVYQAAALGRKDISMNAWVSIKTKTQYPRMLSGR